MSGRSSLDARKFELDSGSTQLLKTLKARTGFTHQYLCRLGLVLSFAEEQPPNPAVYDRDGTEFNRYTLTGEWDALFIAYLREWLQGVDAGGHDEADWFCAHINNGLAIMARRVRTLADVAALVPAA
jgi:DNA sulfur modification protein DndE